MAINVAITGTGFMGTVHAEALKRLSGIHVVGIQGSTVEKSRAAAKALDLDKGYDSWEALVADDTVDAVHVTTPNRLHYSQAVDALNAGKHVLCEKPLAMDTEESAALVRLADQTGLVCAVNYNIRFYPLNMDARCRVAAHELGEIHSMVGSYQQDWLLFDTDYNWRVLADAGGKLRAVADIGTHWIDLVQYLSGQKVSAVHADLKTIHPIRKRPAGEVQTFSGEVAKPAATTPIEVSTEDTGCLMLRFDGGANGMVFISQVTPGRKNCLRYELSGTHSSIEWNSESPNQIWRGHRDRPNEVLIKDPGLQHAHSQKFTDYPGGHAEGFPDTFKMCFRAFYQAVATGEMPAQPDFATFADGHREVQVCEAVLKSNAEQRWVTL